MSKLFVLPAMLFLHVFDDFFIQAILLSKLKQKAWWEENAPDPAYKNDYRMALAAHAFSWTFAVMFPIAVFYTFNPNILFYPVMVINAVIHYTVDDMKANQHKLNLIIDQSAHIIQILLTYLILLCV